MHCALAEHKRLQLSRHLQLHKYHTQMGGIRTRGFIIGKDTFVEEVRNMILLCQGAIWLDQKKIKKMQKKILVK